MTMALGLGFALSGCGGSERKVDTWSRVTGDQNRVLKTGATLDGVTVPVLRAPGLERVWGPPKIELDGKGGYCLTYADPRQSFTRLMIHGVVKPLPKLSAPPLLGGEEMVDDQLTGFTRPQSWRQVQVLDSKVRWYQESTAGGADGAYYSTEGFTLKAPDGRKGHYRLVAEYGDDTEAVARWFGSVSF